MHHPDICNIILIIDDYFLLVDDKGSKCQIESIVYETNDDDHILGLRVSRKLLNGYISIDICGEGQDDDTLTFFYLKHMNNCNSYLESIEIECSDYSGEAARKAIKTILRLDKAAIKSTPIPIGT